ncbi:MAG: hypothetical protein U0271_22085 [Polyangiaceae bacterium]
MKLRADRVIGGLGAEQVLLEGALDACAILDGAIAGALGLLARGVEALELRIYIVCRAPARRSAGDGGPSTLASLDGIVCRAPRRSAAGDGSPSTLASLDGIVLSSSEAGGPPETAALPPSRRSTGLSVELQLGGPPETAALPPSRRSTILSVELQLGGPEAALVSSLSSRAARGCSRRRSRRRPARRGSSRALRRRGVRRCALRRARCRRSAPARAIARSIEATARSRRAFASASRWARTSSSRVMVAARSSPTFARRSSPSTTSASASVLACGCGRGARELLDVRAQAGLELVAARELGVDLGRARVGLATLSLGGDSLNNVFGIGAPSDARGAQRFERLGVALARGLAGGRGARACLRGAQGEILGALRATSSLGGGVAVRCERAACAIGERGERWKWIAWIELRRARVGLATLRAARRPR